VDGEPGTDWTGGIDGTGAWIASLGGDVRVIDPLDEATSGPGIRAAPSPSCAAMTEHPPPPRTLAELDDRLSAPDQATVDALATLDGDLAVLGAGGKMGPTLARMARRALDAAGVPRTGPGARRVIAVSRFGDPAAAGTLAAHGIEVVRADLSDPRAVATLPETPNVLWLAGQKFGTSGDPVATWTHNVVAPVHAAERYAGARIVCFSTGNVYGRTPVARGGSREADPLLPDGEYAASCIGRERVFTAVARRSGSPLLLYRLFYACDLRYGVVTDLALAILRGDPVDLTVGQVNVIWQGDANRLALRALTAAGTPEVALNVTGPAIPVRVLAESIGRAGGVPPIFSGSEAPDALLANVDRLTALLPHEAMPPDQVCAWAVAWIRQGGLLLGKPTKYEVRDGRF
jgi:nucleoside-diphosphate-sugar epimerase